MQTALRKMGNSTGVIIPKGILGQAGLHTGTLMDVSLEGERVVLTPVRKHPREGWEESAALIAQEHDPELEDWLNVPNEEDAKLEW